MYEPILTLYKEHLGRMLALGDPEWADQADDVFELELALAKQMERMQVLRDPRAILNPRSLDDDLHPLWRTVLEGAGVFQEEEEEGKPFVINVQSPLILSHIESVIFDQPCPVCVAYAKYHILKVYAPTLGQALIDEHHAFYFAVLQGQQSPKPRWQRVVALANALIGQSVGQLYVAKFFPPESKENAFKMAVMVKNALQDRLATLQPNDWLDEPTRIQAAAKMAQCQVNIGFPDEWEDLSTLAELVVGKDLSYAEFALLARQWRFSVDVVQRIGQPVDQKRWEFPPQTINAYYHPVLNHVVFPAAILQAPFFNASAPLATNLGAFGAVVGHELTHACDDQGRQLDEQGKLREWWSPEADARFNAKAALIVERYGRYKVNGDPVNGNLTLGENIADAGGVRLALRALERAGEGEAENQKLLFTSWAELWRATIRPAAQRMYLAMDPHSPSPWRVNGVLSAIHEFHQVYQVQPGDPMWVGDEERIW